MFGGGVLFAVGIAYIHQTLHGSDADFGFLAALWGAGMGLGLATVRLLVKRGKDKVFLLAVRRNQKIGFLAVVQRTAQVALEDAPLFGRANQGKRVASV